MKFLKIITLLTPLLFLSNCTPQDFGATGNCGWFGCTQAETASSPGWEQYTTPVQVGKDKYMSEGYQAGIVTKGAKLFCDGMGKTMEFESFQDNTLIFKCL